TAKLAFPVQTDRRPLRYIARFILTGHRHENRPLASASPFPKPDHSYVDLEAASSFARPSAGAQEATTSTNTAPPACVAGHGAISWSAVSLSLNGRSVVD